MNEQSQKVQTQIMDLEDIAQRKTEKLTLRVKGLQTLFNEIVQYSRGNYYHKEMHRLNKKLDFVISKYRKA